MQSQSEKTYPILYGVSKTDKIKQWQISVKLNPDKTATIETQNGYVDGKMNISHRIITTGKNIGKKNETTVFEQAVSEADRKYKDKIEKDGYSTDADNIEEKVNKLIDDMNWEKKKLNSSRRFFYYRLKDLDLIEES